MAEARVYMKGLWNNAAAGDDVSAAEALAGDVTVFTIPVKNYSNVGTSQGKAWLDPACTFLEISGDGVAYSTPYREEDAVDIGSGDDNGIPGGSSVNVYTRRTIPAGQGADPKVPVIFHIKASVL